MDLSLSKEDLAFQQEVRSFMEEVLPEGSPYRGLNLFTQGREESAWWQKKLNDRGWGCIGWPEEYGGTGWNDAQKQIFAAESARAEAPMQSPFGETMVGPVIYTFGTQEQKDQHLENIRNGSTFWCQGYSEPGCWLRFGLFAHQRGARWRRLYRQWSENLDHASAFCRLDFLPRAHQNRRQAARGHFVSVD